MSDKLTWTFRSVPFIVTGSDRVRPRFEHEPRGSVHNLVGNGVAEFLSFGFQEYRMEVPVLVLMEVQAVEVLILLIMVLEQLDKVTMVAMDLRTM